VISVQGLTHRYDRTVVLDEVGLTIPVGRLTSIIGPNGAGKSTLLSVVSRLLRPERGQVVVGGLDVATAADDVIARTLAVLRQDNRIAARLSVVDLVRFGRFPYSKGRLRQEDHDKVEEAIAYLELEEYRDRYLDQLSGGQRQRAYIAMVLAQDTDYVLLDEPLNNLDMKHSAAMMTMLRRAADDLGKTIVLVLHDINFASSFSDHIVAMRDGRVLHQGTPQDIMERQVLREVFDMDIHIQDLHGMRLGIFWTPGAPVGPAPVMSPTSLTT
jgi:iron complex transport system ATP-binding protein